MVTVLQRDKPGFQRPQQGDRAADDERRPKGEMYPDRRGEFDLDQSSERHDSGLALRFPRIERIRGDKTPADIDTLDTARQLVRKA